MQSALQNSLPLSHRPLPLENSLFGKIVLTIAATEFVAVCAHVSVPLPFTVVPLTLQTFAVILVGMLFGPVVGFSSMVLYLAEGATGLPVFSPHGLGGVAQLAGPTGGFLYLLSARRSMRWLLYPQRPPLHLELPQRLHRRHHRQRAHLRARSLLAQQLQHLGLSATLNLSVLPFLPGEIVKITAAAGIFSSLQRWRQTQN